MLMRRIIVLIYQAALMILAGAACGQNYPNRSIRIVTSPAGSGIDFQTRLIAQGISGPLGQPVIVENRPSGVIPGQIVAKALPDGYTMLYAGGNLMIQPLLEKTPYDPVKDFSPITIGTRAPSLLVVTSTLPVKSVKDLIALAKAKPGELNFSTAATGSISYLAAELLKSMAGVNILRVPYSNGTQETADLISGQVHLTVASATSVSAHLKSGSLRALAVTSITPWALFPELPTVAATVPGYEAVQTYAMYAPVNTPAAIINRLNQEIVRALRSADAQEKLLAAGFEVVGNSPEGHAMANKAMVATWGKLIKDAAIR
jgi:tripartite-type tricarboxylate transporter receptor subunit TctC